MLSEVKRQKSVPEDLKKVEEDRGSQTEVDLQRPFEEEVCSYKMVSSFKTVNVSFLN